jgi:hypothetical protein
MDRRLASSLVLIIALLLCPQLAHGQQSSPAPADKAAAELREKAYDLLASVADQISTLQSAENRARMGSNIAGSLWTHDEKRARALFKLVEDDIKLGLQVPKGAPNEHHTFQVFYKLRENTAERMAQHDPELALEFVRETAPVVNEYARLPSGGNLPSVERQEQELELRLAKRIGATNPEVAIKLARQSLAHGFSRDLLPVLRRASKNQEQTTALYKEIVAKLRDADFEDWQTRDFAPRLAQSYTPPAADESTFRELINIFVTKALATGCAKPKPQEHDSETAFCFQLLGMFHWIEKFYPLEARRLKNWQPERQERAFGFRGGYAELDELMQDSSIEEVLALASKYPELEGAIHMRAMWMAESTGDLEQAKKIAASYTGDPEVRQTMEERVKYYNRFSASNKEEWAEALRRTSLLPLHMQVTALMNIFHSAALQDKNTALKMIAHISDLVDALPPGAEQTERQIELATLYCSINSDRGFAIMEGLLPKLNELIAAGAKLDGYDARYLRDGEWNMTGEGAVGKILTILALSAGYFAWSDFDRAVTLAGQFERSEIRMMAQLKLAQGILAGPAKRFPVASRVIHE